MKCRFSRHEAEVTKEPIAVLWRRRSQLHSIRNDKQVHKGRKPGSFWRLQLCQQGSAKPHINIRTTPSPSK